MTNYEKGRNYEYRSMRVLEAAGYETSRSAGSRGVWDVAGFSIRGVVLCSVKFDYSPCTAEIEQFKLFPVPPGTVKLIHIWRKRAREPIVKVL